jgi:hypothetical protein
MQETRDYTATPDDLELLEFFESEPIESVPSDGYWCYEFTDENGLGIRLSCNALAKSVQTVLLVNGREIETVVHEGAEEMKIENGALQCSFALDQLTQLEIKVRPDVAVQWSSLRT